MYKYFGKDIPFEGYITIYQVKQMEGQCACNFGVTLTLLGIYFKIILHSFILLHIFLTETRL